MYLDEHTYQCKPKNKQTLSDGEVFLSPSFQFDDQNNGSLQKPFNFLNNAITRAIELGAEYKESTVTIYLMKGDHFVLRKDYQMYDPAISDETALTLNLVIKPLYCDLDPIKY
jgi:hypothetical protein